jgi:hypothetical protein
MEIRPVRAELFREDEGTDGLDKANSRCSQFCESLEKMLRRHLNSKPSN